MEETILLQLIQSISIVFISIVCLSTYGIIRIVSNIIKGKVSRQIKSLISLIIGILISILYIYKLNASIETVLLSFLICTFGYDLIIKPITKNIFKSISNIKNIES